MFITWKIASRVERKPEKAKRACSSIRNFRVRKKNDLQLKAKLLLWNRKRYARQDKLVSFHDYHDSFFFTSYLQAVISWLLYFFLFDGIKNCDVIDPLNINVNTKIHSCFFRTPCITKNIRYLIKILNIPCHQKS